MKKLGCFICIILVCSLLLAVPAQAQSTVTPRASAFFSSYGTALEKASSISFRIWFDVVANVATMDVLGVSEIAVYSSPDQQTWTKMKTYKMADYPQMVEQNSTSHEGYVTYNYTTPGYYYTARVTFYAKNSTGIGELDVYTEILRM